MARNETKRKTVKLKMPKMEKRLDQQKQLQPKTSRCVSTLIKPLRIFQFFVTLLLFAFTIYMISMDPTPISILACILLIVLSGVFVFVLAVELISHFAGNAFHIIPMTIFSLLGLVFFGVAGILLILYAYTQHVTQMVAMTLCLLASLFFLIDITMVFAFWKRKCSVCKRCCDNSAVEFLPHKHEEPKVPETQIIRHDVTTSLSDIRIPRELEGVATPDHCYRKVGYPRRREYVDCPTCVPSMCNVDVAEIQTEPKRVSVVESQTPSVITKETPMQTLSRCEFCHQQIQLPFAPPVAEGAGVPSTYCFQHTSQWSYPAIVQFVRGGVGVPCCPGCKCATGTAQTQQQPQQLTQQRKESLARKVKSNSNKTLTSEATEQVASTESGNDNVTRLTTIQPTTYTVASFYGDQRKQIMPHIAYKQKVDATKIKENAKPTRKDVNQKLAKTERPKITEETIIGHEKRRKSLDGRKESEEEKTIGKIKIERSKGGGEHYNRICQEFMRATEQGSMTDLEESLTYTQMGGTLITPPSRMKPRVLLHLKSNKVDPIKNVNVFDEDQIPEKIASRMLDKATQENERSRTDSPNPAIEHQLNDACSFCRQQKNLTPTSDNSRCYTVFKDRQAKYFCEFCAPSDSKKIMSRLEGTDLRKRCANCRSHLRDRVIKTNVKVKSDVCPKCGRSQRHAASSSST